VSGTAAGAAAVKRGVLPSAGNIVVKFRGIADEAAVVLLPGKGFDTPHPSARVSLARLSEGDYTRIGHVLCATMDDCFAEFQTGARNGGLDCRLQHRWQPAAAAPRFFIRTCRFRGAGSAVESVVPA
jgi:hypothetical protein